MSQQTPEQLAAAIAALEAQRALLSDAVVDTALVPLREKLAALRAPQIAAAAQQLKQVSVLFVDVVGSTAMGQQLDPETIHEVMDSALERFTAVVQAEGGRVLRYNGDGVLAAFGTATASEDDVECAIRAGLRILDEAKAHAAKVRLAHAAANFNVRVGVHTGRVLLGGGVEAEGSISGAAVNIAARMEQSAPPGRLRISHDSWRHVRGLFEFEAQPPISVKGVAQPMGSWLVVRALPPRHRSVPRGVEGVHTRMVGRDAELALLLQTLQRTVSEGRASAVTAVGEAGLGKSRLLAEFERQIDPGQVWLLLGRAHPRSTVEPFGLLRDLLLRHLQIGENEPAAVVRDKLVAQLAPLFADDGPAPAHLLGHLVGLDYSASQHVRDLLGDEARLRQHAFEAGALWLRRLGASRPVVMVLDDLHWADSGSIDFVLHVMQEDADVPQLCLALTRQTVYEQHAQWMKDLPRHTRLDLKPLDKAHSQELAGGLLQRIADVPEALFALVIDGAEGNPFYMEELVKMFIDDGVIVVEPEGWRVRPDRLPHAHVPPTLTRVLQARLDALSPGERRALQHAAVAGHKFWDQALAAIDPAALQQLPQLLSKELIVQREAVAPDNTREYTFKHHLLHQVTYDSVLKAPKREGHAKAGAFWRERAQTASPRDVDPARCRALAEAQYHGCEADAKDYVGWFESQFPHYFEAYASQALWPLVEQLVVFCEHSFGHDHPQTALALNKLARVALMQGHPELMPPLLQRALAIQEQTLPPDHVDASLTHAAMGGYYSGHGDLAAAEPHMQRALAIRELALGPEHPLTLGALDNLAKALAELGRLDEAETLFRRVLDAHERCAGPAHSDTAFALTALGEVLAKKGDHPAAEALIRRALAVQQKLLGANHPDTGLSLWHLAETLRCQQRHGEAEPLAREALRIWEAHFGIDHEWTAWGGICLAELRLALGDAPASARLAERAAQSLQRAYGDQHPIVVSTRVLQARALLQLGEPAAAESLLQHALGVHVRRGTSDGPDAQVARHCLVQARTALLHR